MCQLDLGDCGNLFRTDLNYILLIFALNKENIFLGCKDESVLLNLLIILTKTIFTNANSMKQSQTQLS
jgi:hypothetical protein